MTCTMNIGKKHEVHKNIQMCIDGWNVKSVDNPLTGETEWEDSCDVNMKEISHINAEKYLGQTISSDSTNTSNVIELPNKEIGIQNKIIQMLEQMP